MLRSAKRQASQSQFRENRKSSYEPSPNTKGQEGNSEQLDCIYQRYIVIEQLGLKIIWLQLYEKGKSKEIIYLDQEF